MKPDDPRFTGMITLLRRTGATATTIRYSEPDEGEEGGPTVWFAIAHHDDQWDAAAGQDPGQALVRLCEQLIGGGTCAHCHLPTSFVPEGESPGRFAQVLGRPVCWITWDAERECYVQDCGGKGRTPIEPPV